MLHPDRRLAVCDKADGPVYLIAILFVDYFFIHYKNDLHAIGEFWAREPISRQIPCQADLIPCSRELIPCSAA
jgi:hypothetical protein